VVQEKVDQVNHHANGANCALLCDSTAQVRNPTMNQEVRAGAAIKRSGKAADAIPAP
jgi:hypothetical protein